MTPIEEYEATLKLALRCSNALLELGACAQLVDLAAKAHPLYREKFEKIGAESLRRIVKNLRGELLCLSIGIDTDKIRQFAARN